MIEFKTEQELEYKLIGNFNKIFPFKYKTSQFTIWNEDKIHYDRIDLIGEDENNEYVIELKRDYVRLKDIDQVLNYAKIYKNKILKNVISCIASPYINEQTRSRAEKNDVMVFELVDYICTAGYNCCSHKLNRMSGKREGAGRPATGAMPTRSLRMTDKEYIKVKEFLQKLRDRG